MSISHEEAMSVVVSEVTAKLRQAQEILSELGVKTPISLVIYAVNRYGHQYTQERTSTGLPAINLDSVLGVVLHNAKLDAANMQKALVSCRLVVNAFAFLSDNGIEEYEFPNDLRGLKN